MGINLVHAAVLRGRQDNFPDSGGFGEPKYCYDIGKSMCDPRVTEVPPCGVFSTEMCWPDEEAGFRPP